MTLKEKIVADTSAVFLNADHFADDVEHWPNGSHLLTETWPAVVDWDGEQGENSGLADKSLTDRAGRRQDAYVVLECAITRSVSDKSKFVLTDPETGERHVAHAMRRLGHDAAMQSWLVKVQGGISTRHSRVR